ncbi:hypothetical protein JCM8547_003538 [Rhodosporidiobolus lusitaniae]
MHREKRRATIPPFSSASLGQQNAHASTAQSYAPTHSNPHTPHPATTTAESSPFPLSLGKAVRLNRLPSAHGDADEEMERWIKEVYYGRSAFEEPPAIPQVLARNVERPDYKRDGSSGASGGTSATASLNAEDDRERFPYSLSSQTSTPASSLPPSPPTDSISSFDPEPSTKHLPSPFLHAHSSLPDDPSPPPRSRPNPLTQPPTDPPINLSAKELVEYYRQHGFLPAPKGEHEAARLRTIKRYGLDKPERLRMLDKIVSMAKTHFKVPTVIVTLVLEGRQVLVSETGWIAGAPDPPLEKPPRELSRETAFCAHAVANPHNPFFFVPDASKDFRFCCNPLSQSAGGPLAFYASAVVTLPTASSHPPSALRSPVREVPSALPVGALCLIGDEPREAGAVLSEEDKRVLGDLAELVGREFQYGFEQRRREIEQQRTAFIGSFLDSTLVYTHTGTEQSTSPSTAPSPLQGVGEAVDKLIELTGVDAAAIFDLRSFRAPQSTKSGRGGSTSSVGAGVAVSSPLSTAPTSEDTAADSLAGDGFVRARTDGEFGEGLGRVFLLGGAGCVDWKAETKNPMLPGAVCETLKRFYETGQIEFDTFTPHSAFEHLLPVNATASMLLPVFDVDSTNPALLIVLASVEPSFTFDPSDRTFVRNIGAVAVSGLLRERALEAEAAKLKFISTISHELRTPLHGINSQLELLREFSSPETLLKIAPLLDCAEVSIETLRDVLDDTLDFSKLSTNSQAEIDEAQQRSLARHDLATICEDVAKSVWVRNRRIALVNADAEAANGRAGGAAKRPVDVVLEVEERKGGWGVWVDSGGMKRVLLNICGNAMKFTDEGSVKISLCEVPGSPAGLDENHGIVQITVTDTGRGMSEEFLREGRLFMPFARENPYGRDGAGLGLSITQTIVARFGGKLDVASALGTGSTFRITVPLEFAPPQDPQTPLAIPSLPRNIAFAPRPRATSVSLSHVTFRRRIISEELSALFSPSSKLSPFVEKPSFDFSQAVEAAQASITPKLGGVPPLRRKRSGLGSKASEGDLVDDLAKLSVAAASSPNAVNLAAPGGSYFAISNGATSSLPTSPLRQRTEMPSMPMPSFIPAQQQKSRVRVLVADDNPVSRSILAKLFQGKGIAFAQAENGVEAVKTYTSASPSSRFHLILSDLRMPLLDGFGLARQVRAHEFGNGWHRCRFVALSGLSSSAEQREAEESGVDEFLVKGGKSLAVIMREVKAIEEELEAAEKA